MPTRMPTPVPSPMSSTGPSTTQSTVPSAVPTAVRFPARTSAGASGPRRVVCALARALAVVVAVTGAAPGAAVGATGFGSASGASTRGVASAWVPPLDRPLDALGVLAPFDPPAQDWLPGHRGVDLAASPGEVVLSPSAGVVTFAGPVAGRDVLVVLHDDGLRTSLEPVTATVARGTRVGAGSRVGTVELAHGGATASRHGGHCADTCVHWGVRRGETYLDPLGLLGDRPPIVLLPLR